MAGERMAGSSPIDDGNGRHGAQCATPGESSPPLNRSERAIERTPTEPFKTMSCPDQESAPQEADSPSVAQTPGESFRPHASPAGSVVVGVKCFGPRYPRALGPEPV